MKLWKGNVFTDICLFTVGHHVTIIHNALDLTVQPPSPDIRSGTSTRYQTRDPLVLTSDGQHVQICSFENPSPPLTTDIWWLTLESCSNVFTLRTPLPPPPMTSGYWSTYGLQAGGAHPNWYAFLSRHTDVNHRRLISTINLVLVDYPEIARKKSTKWMYNGMRVTYLRAAYEPHWAESSTILRQGILTSFDDIRMTL